LGKLSIFLKKKKVSDYFLEIFLIFFGKEVSNLFRKNSNEGNSIILPNQRILQLMEFYHFIQRMKFENQVNSIESIELPNI
jgi:hypothetical protein